MFVWYPKNKLTYYLFLINPSVDILLDIFVKNKSNYCYNNLQAISNNLQSLIYFQQLFQIGGFI